MNVLSSCEKRIAALATGLFALVPGLNYAIGDQSAYILPAIRRLHPDMLALDWYTTKVTHHHGAFSWLVFLSGKALPLSFILPALNIAAYAAIGVLAYRFICLFYRRPFPIFLCALVTLELITNHPVLSAPFMAESLTPASISNVLFLLGWYFFLAARPWHAGIALGFCGLMHANFLVLNGGLVLLVLAFSAESRSPKTLIALLVPFSFISLPTTLSLVQDFLGDVATNTILYSIRSPHHYAPTRWPLQVYVEFLATIAAGAVGLRLRPLESGPRALLGKLLLSMSLITVGWLFITIIAPVPTITALFGVRLAPFLSMSACIAFAAGLAQTIDPDVSAEERRKGLTLLPVLALLAFGVSRPSDYILLAYLGTLTAIIALLPALGTGERLSSQVASPMLARGTLIILTAHAAWALCTRSVAFSEAPDTEKAAVYAFARERTPIDAVFVVPPNVSTFRLWAKRSIVVDWISEPFRSSQLEEWQTRLLAESGLAEISDLPQAMAGYREMDYARATSLRHAYGATHILVESTKHHGRLSPARLLYRDANFSIYALGGGPP